MSPAIVIVPFAVQAVAMGVDEVWFHRRRGLPRWERLGHPLDTLTFAACLVWLLATSPGEPAALPIYAGLAIFSILFVTKDEPVHARLCSAGEHWLHALLFALHPIVLAAFALAWWAGWRELLAVQLIATLGFCSYQFVYWQVVHDRRATARAARAAPPRPATGPAGWINNDWYGELGARWYSADDSPIALLRAEARHRNPWLAQVLARELGDRPARVLDLGCGAGFLSNYLAERGHDVTGLDTQAESLAVARRFDRSGRARYQVGDACALPFADHSFDAVCAMDLIEHIDEPARLIAEASRVLAPSGLVFFHTFNRNWLSHLVVIKGVEWFVRNTPRDLHVIELFRTPDEVTRMLHDSGLAVVELHGSRPCLNWPFLRMLATRRVGDDFAFTFTRSTRLGYTGYARKPPAPR